MSRLFAPKLDYLFIFLIPFYLICLSSPTLAQSSMYHSMQKTKIKQTSQAENIKHPNEFFSFFIYRSKWPHQIDKSTTNKIYIQNIKKKKRTSNQNN